ncbi:MAG: hypothetical protein NTX61_04250 [Bacteroidetes bacterium]|nr:hypothetical protein [Bacteroidota bacterium]
MIKFRQIHEKSLFHCVLKIIVSVGILLFIGSFTSIQAKSKKTGSGSQSDSIHNDTVFFSRGILIIGKDFFVRIPRDTFWLVNSLSLGENNIAKMKQAEQFYDSVYRKFARHGMTRFLYSLAFVPPKNSLLPDTVQRMPSEYPFEQFRGKIIRSIRTESLSPFGTSVVDTCMTPETGISKFGNAIHVITKKFVIRKYLIFKTGQSLDPGVMADNERILRSLHGIEDARIIVTPCQSNPDSIDIIVITKDVWSIGFDILSATTNRALIRLYDGNFLGLGDRFLHGFSFEKSGRAFFMYDNASYNMTNIGGTFIDGTAGFSQDDDGYQNFQIQLSRTFFSNKTRWAGNGQFQYIRDTRIPGEPVNTASYYHNASLWLGYAFPFIQAPIHMVISEGVYQRYFYSRPSVLYDTNNLFNNYIKVFTGLSISKNKYYLTDYVSELGKTENIPYGYMVQLTLGPEFINYQTRFYHGFEVSVGDFINRFGYLMGDVRIGGFLHNSSFEDGVLKFHVMYMTYLQQPPNKRYKIRTYLKADYMLGFNTKENNKDLADISQIMRIQPVDDHSLLQGTRLLAANLSTALFTPWFFYGFRFALIGQLQGGFIARNKSVFATPFYPGIKTSVVIKNDNLIFPAMVFSLFFYPDVSVNSPWLQYMFDVNTGIHLSDFNVSGPHQEILQN